MGLGVRGAAAAVGLLCLAVVTAAAASGQTADLVITESAAPNPVAAGSTVTTTITVANLGPSAASNVAMAHWTPPNHTFGTVGGIPAGWTCASAGPILQCNIPTLAVGAVATFHPGYVVSSETPAGLVLIDDA